MADPVINLSVYDWGKFDMGKVAFIKVIASSKEQAIEKILSGLLTMKELMQTVELEIQKEIDSGVKRWECSNKQLLFEKEMDNHPTLLNWQAPFSVPACMLLDSTFTEDGHWLHPLFDDNHEGEIITFEQLLRIKEPKIIPIISDGEVVNMTLLFTTTCLEA